MKCAICGNTIHNFGNNGQPLVEGRVCDSCNWKVIKERLRLLGDQSKSEKPASESVSGGEIDGVVVGNEGTINTSDPMKDFEEYAKKFEETFVLGKTPVHKEKVENKTKVKDGKVEGEVISLDRDKEAEQVEPVKSATESLKGFSEIYEFLRLCKELGIEDMGLLQRFVDENPGDPLTVLRNYKENYLPKGWENEDLSEKDKKEIFRLRLKEILARDEA